MRCVAARALIAVAVSTSLLGCGDDSTPTAASTTTVPPATTAPTTSAPPTTADQSTTTPTPTTVPTTASPSTTRPSHLQAGAEGPEVVALQQRLSELGYWIGAVDGEFGDATAHAVVALQKAAGLPRDGVVGPATRAALDQGVRPQAVSAAGHVVEIDLARQLLLIVDDGLVTLIFDTSTGRIAGTTPPGRWTVEREIDGYRRSSLGLLYRPKYFHRGVAIHGYTSVPVQPASHGCVRVTYAAMDHIWTRGLAPLGTAVWVY